MDIFQRSRLKQLGQMPVTAQPELKLEKLPEAPPALTPERFGQLAALLKPRTMDDKMAELAQAKGIQTDSPVDELERRKKMESIG